MANMNSNFDSSDNSLNGCFFIVHLLLGKLYGDNSDLGDINYLIIMLTVYFWPSRSERNL